MSHVGQVRNGAEAARVRSRLRQGCHYTNKCHFIYAHEKISSFSVLIFMKLTETQCSFMDIPSSKFHLNGMRTYKMTTMFNLNPWVKFSFHYANFNENPINCLVTGSTSWTDRGGIHARSSFSFIMDA